MEAVKERGKGRGENIHTYHRKNGSQQSIKVPMIMPRVRAALCSRFILIKCLSFVGVCSCSTSCSVNVFDEPEPLSASPDDDDECVEEKTA